MFTRKIKKGAIVGLAALAVSAAMVAPAALAQGTIKPSAVKKAKGLLRSLVCTKTNGDVVARPIVINTTGKTLPIGRKIFWQARLPNGAISKGIYTLSRPLYAGQSRVIPKQLHWRFTCTARVFV